MKQNDVEFIEAMKSWIDVQKLDIEQLEEGIRHDTKSVEIFNKTIAINNERLSHEKIRLENATTALENYLAELDI